MLVNLYKSKTPVAIFSFPVLIGLLCLPILFMEDASAPTFFSWQHDLIEFIASSNVIHYSTAVLIVYLSALELNRVVNTYGFYSKNSYLPGVIYVLALMGFGQFRFSMLLIAYGLVVFGIGFIFRINRQDSALSSVFMASFFLGTSTVFEPMLFPAVVLPWVALAVFRAFNWREWVALIVGVGVPWLYHYGMYYTLTGNLEILTETFALAYGRIQISPEKISLMTFMFLMIVFSIWKFLIIQKSQLLAFKKRSRLLFHLVWLALISFILGWYFYDSMIITVIIPFSIIVSVQMLNSNKTMYSNVALTIWIGLILWNVLN